MAAVSTIAPYLLFDAWMQHKYSPAWKNKLRWRHYHLICSTLVFPITMHLGLCTAYLPRCIVIFMFIRSGIDGRET